RFRKESGEPPRRDLGRAARNLQQGTLTARPGPVPGGPARRVSPAGGKGRANSGSQGRLQTVLLGVERGRRRKAAPFFSGKRRRRAALCPIAAPGTVMAGWLVSGGGRLYKAPHGDRL